MSFFIFLTVVQALVAAALVGVILIQKSEGGGLGVGGSPAGFMSARGAADFLTRATTLLATAFVGLSIILAALAVRTTANREIDASLARTAPAAPLDPLAPVQGVPAVGPAEVQPAAPPAPLPAASTAAAAKEVVSDTVSAHGAPPRACGSSDDNAAVSAAITADRLSLTARPPIGQTMRFSSASSCPIARKALRKTAFLVREPMMPR